MRRPARRPAAPVLRRRQPQPGCPRCRGCGLVPGQKPVVRVYPNRVVVYPPPLVPCPGCVVLQTSAGPSGLDRMRRASGEREDD